VFGFSLSELIVVIVVALVVIGPKDLPKMLRKLGQYAGKLRRMASELRAQSGIDDALRTEGLADDIAEIRKLARGELDAVRSAASVDAMTSGGSASGARPTEQSPYRDDFFVVRDREYPRDGADSYGALPDNAIVYAEGLPRSKLARDPLYVLADPDGVVPEPPPPVGFGEDLGPVPEKPPFDPDRYGLVDSSAEENADAKVDPDAKAVPSSEAETQDPPAVTERSSSEAR
jgi:sec-independent protein translocase protein TatB